MGVFFGPPGSPVAAAGKRAVAKAAAKRAAAKGAAKKAVPRAVPRLAPKPVAKPKAKKAVKRGPTARQKAAAGISKKEAAFRAQQAKEAKALETEFTGFRKGLEPLDVLRQRLGLELGIPGLQAQLEPLQQRALRLGQLQLDLPETVGALTRGQGEARRKLLETSKGEDLARQLRDVAISQEFFTGQLTGARGELTEQLGVTQAQRDFDLRAFGAEADILSSRLAREVEGYTTALQTELEGILGDIRRAEELSDAAVQRAFELAKMEKAAALQAAKGGGGGTAKEPSERERKAQTALRQLGQIAASGAGKNLVLGAARNLAAQFPEFSDDFFKLAERLTGTAAGSTNPFE